MHLLVIACKPILTAIRGQKQARASGSERPRLSFAQLATANEVSVGAQWHASKSWASPSVFFAWRFCPYSFMVIGMPLRSWELSPREAFES